MQNMHAFVHENIHILLRFIKVVDFFKIKFILCIIATVKQKEMFNRQLSLE